MPLFSQSPRKRPIWSENKCPATQSTEWLFSLSPRCNYHHRKEDIVGEYLTRITFVPERATIIDYVRNAQRCRCGLKNVQRYHWKHRHCHCNHHCHHERHHHHHQCHSNHHCHYFRGTIIIANVTAIIIVIILEASSSSPMSLQSSLSSRKSRSSGSY